MSLTKAIGADLETVWETVCAEGLVALGAAEVLCMLAADTEFLWDRAVLAHPLALFVVRAAASAPSALRALLVGPDVGRVPIIYMEFLSLVIIKITLLFVDLLSDIGPMNEGPPDILADKRIPIMLVRLREVFHHSSPIVLNAFTIRSVFFIIKTKLPPVVESDFKKNLCRTINFRSRHLRV